MTDCPIDLNTNVRDDNGDVGVDSGSGGGCVVATIRLSLRPPPPCAEESGVFDFQSSSSQFALLLHGLLIHLEDECNKVGGKRFLDGGVGEGLNSLERSKLRGSSLRSCDGDADGDGDGAKGSSLT